jgi:hypothetical protein
VTISYEGEDRDGNSVSGKIVISVNAEEITADVITYETDEEN